MKESKTTRHFLFNIVKYKCVFLDIVLDVGTVLSFGLECYESELSYGMLCAEQIQDTHIIFFLV